MDLAGLRMRHPYRTVGMPLPGGLYSRSWLLISYDILLGVSGCSDTTTLRAMNLAKGFDASEKRLA